MNVLPLEVFVEILSDHMNVFAKMVSTKSTSLHTILSTRTLVYHTVPTTFACHQLLVSFDFEKHPHVLIPY